MRGCRMSLAWQWLLLHALLISESSQESLWQLNSSWQTASILTLLGCKKSLHVESSYWCVTNQEFILLTGVADETYIRLSPLQKSGLQNHRLPKRWFGNRVSHQRIDGYEISIYQTPHTQTKLKIAFRLREGNRIVTQRELEHGRFHLVLNQPSTDIFLVAVDKQTYVVEMQKTTRSKPR